ncbi:MAG TPA: protein kinase, partial [Planctomycetaceae bacterium]|nr:protein kinase [Planctomycetaceae bacterium]
MGQAAIAAVAADPLEKWNFGRNCDTINGLSRLAAASWRRQTVRAVARLSKRTLVTEPPPPAESDDPRIEAALREYIEQLDRGESLDVEQFIARHAEIADELRELIETEQKLRQLADDVTRSERANDATQPVAVDVAATLKPQHLLEPISQADKRLSGNFGRYSIVRPLGEGAMGAVYLAEDSQLRRLVAIKTPHFAHEPTGELLERFYREARAAATLRHPNICPVYDVGQIDQTHYFSMAYIEGRPLSAFTDPSNPQSERQILILVRKLAQALEEAHEHKIVHRDLKPANIIVDKRGEPLIMDFGLARQASPEDESRLTHTGTLVGTPAYMSPEQVDGESDKIGPLADEYSLGVIFYELLTGQLPFRGSTAAVLGQIITRPPAPPSQIRAGLDSRTEAVCLKMLAKNPSDRFPTLAAVADELATILRNPAKAATQSGAQSGAELAASSGSQRGVQKPVQPPRKTTFTQEELGSLEELSRKCLARHDYDQVVQIVKQLPEAVRTAPLQSLLETAEKKADDVVFLVCEIDEAMRLNDRRSALAKVEALLRLKPGHHRALEVQSTLSASAPGGVARLLRSQRFDQPWRDGGWVPWGALAFGLAVFAALSWAIAVYVNRTVVTIDVQDSGLSVALEGAGHAVEGPDREKFTVDPGENELTVTRDGAVVARQRFPIAKGRQRTVVVSLADSKVVIAFDQEPPIVSEDREGKEVVKNDNANAEAPPVAQAPAEAARQAIENKGRGPESKALVKFQIRDPAIKASMPGLARSPAWPEEDVTVEPGPKVLTVGFG